jgi:hypothetical protein
MCRIVAQKSGWVGSIFGLGSPFYYPYTAGKKPMVQGVGDD